MVTVAAITLWHGLLGSRHLVAIHSKAKSLLLEFIVTLFKLIALTAEESRHVGERERKTTTVSIAIAHTGDKYCYYSIRDMDC